MHVLVATDAQWVLDEILSALGTAETSFTVCRDGRDVTRMAPHRRSRLGIARTFQRLELFGGLTVLENVECAAGMAHGARRRARNAQRIAEPIIRRIGLSSVAHVRAGLLPTGQARLVEVARALATLPKVLLLDEPASGQTESETEQFARLLGDLAGDGLAVLLVEHDMDLVMHVSKKIVVLNFGRVIASGTPDEIRSNPTVISAYLGSGAGDE